MVHKTDIKSRNPTAMINNTTKPHRQEESEEFDEGLTLRSNLKLTNFNKEIRDI
jgi:hypothetical protein